MGASNWKYKSAGLFLEPELKDPALEDGYQTAWFGTDTDQTLKTVSARWAAAAGVFLFLRMKFPALKKEKDAVITDLESRLREFLLDIRHEQVRFLWVENPAEPLSLWRYNSIAVEGSIDARQLSYLTYLDLHNYTFSIAKGTAIERQEARNEKNETISQFVFIKAEGNKRGFGFSAGNGLHRLYDIGSTATLDMDGNFRGCLRFDLDLKMALTEDEQHFYYPGLSQLDVGLRIFFRDPDFPESGTDFYLASHRYPVLDETHPLLEAPSDDPADKPAIKAANHPLQGRVDEILKASDKWLHKAFNYYPDKIPLSVSLDLLYPLAPARSYFIFKQETDPEKIRLPSAYRTNLGYRVHLTPVGTKSRLQFALRPSLLSDSGTTPFYLVPTGDFEVQVPIYYGDGREDLKAGANVDCGISGVEYIKIKSSPAATLTFVPGQAAYAPSHVSVSALLRDFPIILKEFTDLSLTPDTTDQDVLIPNKRVDIISGRANPDYLDVMVQDYFPSGFSFSEGQSGEYNALERVDELVNWLKDTLIASGGGTGDLSNKASTSWVYIRQGKGAVYYAQPEQALLYKAEASSPDFLDFLEIPSVGLPPLDPASHTLGVLLAFPMLPYGDVDPYALTDLRLLEVSLINSFRRRCIQQISAAEEASEVTPLTAVNAAVKPTGTTPQGLIATYSEDYQTIERLELARDTSEPNPKVIPLVNIQHRTPLKAALQSNQLFMVVSKSESIASNFQKDLVEAVDDLVNHLDATTAMDIKKWVFELGTESWGKYGHNTILIFKFHDKPLIELAARPELWSFPDAFNETPGLKSAELLGLLQNAVEIGNRTDPKESGKYEVLAQAATQANWTGILALNVHVSPSGLPPELLALAAGIDPALFYAQYVGIELTRVTSDGKKLKPEGSSLFGLIDYANPEIPVALGDPPGYNFQVASLSVVFENSRIKDFSSEILIVVERLFDEPSRLLNSRSNIITLVGAAEEHNGKMTYSFGFKGSNRFKLSGNALEEVEIVKTQFVTDPIPNLEANPLPVVGRFIFWGRIRYAYLEKFDILSFGRSPDPKPGKPDYLSFSNLQIKMDFQLDHNATTKPVSTFTFNPNQMAFDLEKSGWRGQSLYEKFPLIFKSFLVGKNDGSVQRGFMDVNTPLDTPLEPVVLGKDGVPWYGMAFSLNMESSEDLGAKALIQADILVGWNAGEKGTYVGLRFPGSSGTDRSITIVGLLKLVFKSIRFVVYPLREEWNEEGIRIVYENKELEVGYLLNLKNIRLEFFKLSFPPTGRTEITLFGDPSTGVEREKRLVGWYGAYVKK